MLFPHYQSMGKLEAPPPRLATSAAHATMVDTNIFAAAAMAAMEASRQDHPEGNVKFERSESISPTPSSKSPIVVASEVSAGATSKPFLKFSINAIMQQNKGEEVGEDEDDAVNISSDLKGRQGTI